MKHTRPIHSQRGMALVVALLVVAIVAAMALLFTSRQQLWMRQLENRNGFTTATMIAFAGIDMTRLTLRDDARNNQSDHLLEPWTIPIPPIAVEEGRIAGRLRELNGRFNLTNLLPVGTNPVREDDPALLRASRASGIGTGDLAALLRAFQAVRASEPSGTPELQELLRRAATPMHAASLATRHFVVLPITSPLNANFADAESLQAAIADLTLTDAGALINRRTSQPFKTLDEVREALPAALRANVKEAAVSVQSSFFMVEIDAWFNDVHLGYEALLRRQGVNMPVVLWARRSKPADS